MPNHVHKLGKTQEEKLDLFKERYKRLALKRRMKLLLKQIEEDLEQINKIIDELVL